jgi:hypothetical protein
VHKDYVLPEFDHEKVGASLGRGYRGQVLLYGERGLVVKRVPVKYKEEFKAEDGVARRAGKFGVGPIVHQSHCDDEYCFLVMDGVVPVKLQQHDRDDVVRLFARAIKRRIVNYDGGFARTLDGYLLMYDFGVSLIAGSSEDAKDRYKEVLEQFHRMKGVRL